MESTGQRAARERDPLEPWLPSPEVIREALDDLAADGGGQRTEVGPPYDFSGGVRRGVERRQHEDARAVRGHHSGRLLVG